MKPAIETISEGAVRAMRDRVYASEIENSDWEQSKSYWTMTTSIKWLEDQCARLDLKDAKP